MGSLWGSTPSLDYFLDDVKCFGNESALLNCHSSPVLSHNCLLTEEAGVSCSGLWNYILGECMAFLASGSKPTEVAWPR